MYDDITIRFIEDIDVCSVDELCRYILKTAPFVSDWPVLGRHVSDVLRYTNTHERNRQYNQFEIPKKSGGTRQIIAPVGDLKTIQKVLAHLLAMISSPNEHAHGFIEEHSVITNAQQRIGPVWDMAELRKYINNMERFLYVLTDFEKDKIKFQTMLYIAAWADAKKYANAEDYLAFRSEPEASTDGTGFYMSKAPSQALWANTRVAVHNNAVKFGIKLVPVAEDLDKDTWNHFWRLYNLLNLSPEMDSYYPGEEEAAIEEETNED